MAGDHQEPTRRKHRRSSSDELDESSKRRKHRHHRHRHSRKNEKHESKRDEESNCDGGIEREGGEATLPPPPSSPPPSGVVSVANWNPDYDDMEEGEIVEEDGGVDLDKKKADSEVESGEIGDAEVRHNHDTVVRGASIEPNGDSSLPSDDNLAQVDGKASLTSGKDNGFDGLATSGTVDRDENLSDGVKIADLVDSRRSLSKKHHDNGHSGRRDSHKDDNSQRVRTSPEERGKRKSYYDDENGLKGQSKSLSSENDGKKHKNLGYSPSRERINEEVHTRNRSRSRDRATARSRSQSISKGVSRVETHHKDVTSYADRKYRQDADERTRKLNTGYRHGSRDLPRDKDRERSSSRSRYSERGDWHHSVETRERDREGSRETWDRERGDREVDRDRKRAEEERERKRERERERDRDRYREKERDRDRERDRERRKDRDVDRDRNRSTGNDRVSRHHHDGYGDHERQDDYRQGVSEMDHRDKPSRGDPEKVHSSRNGHSEKEREKLKREEVEEEDYQERIVLQLADQEEEDLNKIKEESRRRRQAILEKYKTRPQAETHVEDKCKENIENPSGPVAAADVSNSLNARSESADIFLGDASISVGKSPPQNGIPDVEKITGTGGLGEGSPKSERSNDMFRDDIFGESPAGVRKSGKGDGVAIERSGLHDNWDDAEGYYSYRFGEILDGRYEIIAAHGKGVFSTVVRAKDLKAGSGDPEEVAIKIIRNNDTMYKAGLEELVILKKLVGADLKDRRHCVRFLSSFKYRNHLCLVFESLHMNLREVLKKFGRNIGLKLTAVRAYANQLFIALKHLRNCGVLHCDIKPDNMLVNDAKNVLKLCDFGNAMFAGKNEITPYLVSRFYRAPEIILGLTYDHPMDIWSVGCCLFELYSGKVLFPGATNNDMLRLHMELKGPFPKKMLRKGAFIDHHFDQDLNFLATEEDPVTKKAIKRLILNIRPKDIGSIILGSPGEDPKMLANFKDLLEKIFVLDPDKRITVQQALSHPFITGK